MRKLQGQIIGSKGLRPDRLNAIAEQFNLVIETKLVEDKQFGKLLDNGTWNGCVGMLTRHEADVCTMGLAWTVVRNRLFSLKLKELILPLNFDGNCVYLNQEVLIRGKNWARSPITSR